MRKRRFAAVSVFLLLLQTGNARPALAKASSDFPRTVRVRLWYLHPPRELDLRAEAGQAQSRRCATCKPEAVTTLAVRAEGSLLQIGNVSSADLHISGAYQVNAAGAPPLRADF